MIPLSIVSVDRGYNIPAINILKNAVGNTFVQKKFDLKNIFITQKI
jgi:hypothetical protein